MHHCRQLVVLTIFSKPWICIEDIFAMQLISLSRRTEHKRNANDPQTKKQNKQIVGITTNDCFDHQEKRHRIIIKCSRLIELKLNKKKTKVSIILDVHIML